MNDLRTAYRFTVCLPADEYADLQEAEADLLFALNEAELVTTVAPEDGVELCDFGVLPDADPNCEECARSHGPHYKGPCTH